MENKPIKTYIDGVYSVIEYLVIDLKNEPMAADILWSIGIEYESIIESYEKDDNPDKHLIKEFLDNYML